MIWIDAIPNPKLIFPYTLSTFWQLNVTSSMSERISYWPVRHGGTEQGRNHTKESLVVFGSGQAGWVVELTILHETNQTYFKPSNNKFASEVVVTVLSPRTLSSPSLPGRPSTSTLSRFAKLTCAMHRMHGKANKQNVEVDPDQKEISPPATKARLMPKSWHAARWTCSSQAGSPNGSPGYNQELTEQETADDELLLSLSESHRPASR